MDEYLRLTPSPTGAVSERMQALLSRAVEEQVNEQREVQSLLSEVRNALADVQRDTRATPTGDADVRVHLASHATETRTALTQLDERLQAIVHAVATSAQVLQGISGQLERVAEAVREQTTNGGRTEPVAQVRYEVSELRSRLDAVEGAVRGDLAALRENVAGDVQRLHGTTEESTRTIANHVDNAVLVLAEALLRRPAASGAGDVAPAPPNSDEAALPPEAANATEPPDSDDAAVPPEAANATEPPDWDEAAVPPDWDEAAVPPEAANATEPPDSDDAAVPPEAAKAAVPPEAAKATVPPQAEESIAIDPVVDEPAALHELAADAPSFAPLPASAPVNPPVSTLAPSETQNVVDDEAGEVVDADRSDADLPSWARSLKKPAAPPYDDPLGDLPATDETRPRNSFPISAPYDLETALFGDRSRPVPLEAAEQDPPAAEQEAEQVDQDGQRAVEATEALEGHHEDSDIPRRRPWWRPSG